MACAWSPCGSMIATGSEDGTTQIWDTHTFRCRAYHILFGRMRHVKFSPNGRWLACMSDTYRGSILNTASGSLHISLGPHHSSRSYNCTLPIVLSAAISNTAFHPGSMCLAIAPWKGPTINVIDIETGNTLLAWKGKGRESVGDISFSPDGRFILRVVDTTCHIWNASTGTSLFQLQGSQSQEPISKATFSPCGEYVACASWNRPVHLWKTSDGSCLGTFSGNGGHIEFSPDGKTLSFADSDGRVYIRHMHDIIPPDDTQDNRSVIALGRSEIRGVRTACSSSEDSDSLAPTPDQEDSTERAQVMRCVEQGSAEPSDTPTTAPPESYAPNDSECTYSEPGPRFEGSEAHSYADFALVARGYSGWWRESVSLYVSIERRILANAT